MDVSERRAVRDAVQVALIAVAAMLMTNPVLRTPARGLDPGWATGLAMAQLQRLQHGIDVAFTYGPLGWLDHPPMLAPALAAAALAFALVSSIAVATICWLLLTPRIGPVWTPIVLLVLIAPLLGLLTPDERLLSGGLAAALLAIERYQVTPPRTWLPVVFGAGGALMLLVKFSTGTFALVVVGILVLAWIRFPRTLLALTSSYILTFLAAWVISQGGVDGLAAWPRLSLSLASAFAGAMAYYPDPPRAGDFLWFGALVVATLVFTTLRLRRLEARWLAKALMGALAVLALFAGLKLGFVRHEERRVISAFLLVVPLWLWLAPPRLKHRAMVLIWLALPILVLVHVSSWAFAKALVDRDANWTLALHQVTGTHELDAALTTAREANERLYGLSSEILHSLRGRSVQVDPWETSLAWTYDLTWKPVPVFQQYSAYSTTLDDLNTQSLRQRTADEPVLIDTSDDVGLDYSNPLWSPPRYQLALTCGFDLETASGAWEIWTRGSDRCSPARRLATVPVTAGEAVDLPAVDDTSILVARFTPETSLWDSVVSTLYKPAEPLTLTLDDTSYRQPRGLSGAPLIVSCPPASAGTERYRSVCPSPSTFTASEDGELTLESVAFESSN